MMPEWAKLVLFIALYIVVMRWVLPKFGVPTCLSNSCGIAERREKKEPKPDNPR